MAGLGKQGFHMRNAIDLEIAIIRGELTEVERILDTWSPQGLDDVDGLVARLDGLVALDRGEDIEAEAPALVIPGSYLEPFALRALGRARHDDEMTHEAAARFEEMGMRWHADRTRAWVDDR